MLNDRVTCSECGSRPEEWEENSEIYTAHLERCLGCQELALRRKEIPEGEEGIRAFLIPTELAMKIQTQQLQSHSNRPQDNRKNEDKLINFETLG